MKFTAFALLFLAGTFNLGNALRMTGKMESTATAEALSKQKEQLANGNMQGVPHPHRFHGVAIYPDRGIYPFRFAEENANGGSHGQPPVMTSSWWDSGTGANGPRTYPYLAEERSAQAGGSHGQPPVMTSTIWDSGTGANGPRTYPGLAEEAAKSAM